MTERPESDRWRRSAMTPYLESSALALAVLLGLILATRIW